MDELKLYEPKWRAIVESKGIKIDDLPKKARRLINLFEENERKAANALPVMQKAISDGKAKGAVSMLQGKFEKPNSELAELDEEIGEEIAFYLQEKADKEAAAKAEADKKKADDEAAAKAEADKKKADDEAAAKAEADKKKADDEAAYKTAIEKADELFEDEKYAEAKDAYAEAFAEALKLNPEDKYPREQIEEIDSILDDSNDDKEKAEKEVVVEEKPKRKRSGGIAGLFFD